MTFTDLINNFWLELYETTLQWQFLLSSLFVAISFVYLTSNKSLINILKFIFHKNIWLHPSAKIDYKMALVNALIFTILLPFTVYTSIEISSITTNVLESTFGSKEPLILQEPSLMATLIFSFGVLLLADFAAYVMHYMSHKLPFLWALHKVHHSAEVLTPFTTYRTHPVETWISLLFNSLFLGCCYGIMKYTITFSVAEATLLGINIFSFFIQLFGGLLTHSHIRLQWPRWLALFVISPQNHQIHHSNKLKHFDKNFGFWFSIWDVLFGTYYHGTKSDQYGFGIGKEGQDHQKLSNVYINPVKESLNHLKKLKINKP